MKRYLGLGIWLTYGLVFVAMTWPLLAQLNTSVLGSGPDPYQYIWNADVFRSELLSGSNPFYTDRLLFPHGVNLWMHTYTPIIGVVNLLADNPYLSVNLAIILSLMFAGYGAYLLAADFLKSKWFAFACGVVFAFSPYITSHLLEHMHLILVAAVPFFARALFKLFPLGVLSWKTWNRRSLLIMAVCFAITFFSDYYTTFFLIFLTVFYLLYRILSPQVRQWKLSYKIAAVLFLFVGGHLLVEPMHQKGVDDRGAFYNTADASSVLVPPANSAVYKAHAFEDWREGLDFRGPNEQVMFVGLVLFLLFVWYLIKSPKKETALILFLFLVFLLLSIPKIRIMGHSITYSPFAWFHYVPFLNNIRNPSRMVQMVYLFLPILAMQPLDGMLQKGKLKVLALIPLAFVMVEFWPRPYPRIHAKEVDHYNQDILTSGSTVLWYMPSGIKDGFNGVGEFDTKRLQEQLVHKSRLVGAYISRIPEEDFEEWESEAVFSHIQAAIDKRDMYTTTPIEEFRDELILDPMVVESFINKYQIDCIVIPKSDRRWMLFKMLIELNFKPYFSSIYNATEVEIYFLKAKK